MQSEDAPAAFALSGDVRGTHDPAIAKDGGTYYVFATGVAAKGATADSDRTRLPQLPVRCSTDLHVWHRCGAVFAEMPAWIRARSPRTVELWAPDVSYFTGEFHLYYAYSVFGKNTSGIGLATNKTLDRCIAAVQVGGPRAGAGVEDHGRLQRHRSECGARRRQGVAFVRELLDGDQDAAAG
jgi:hypothetical protein